MLTSSSPTFDGSSRRVSTDFLPIFFVSAFYCFHAGGRNIYCVGLRFHYHNIRNSFLPSNRKGTTVVATVSVAAAVDWAWISTVAFVCSSAADSALEVCWMIDWVSMVELIPVTQNANLRLAHLIWLGVCRIDGNLTSVTAYFLVLIACTVPACIHTIIGRNYVLT